MSNPLFSKLRLEELEQRLVLSISGSGTPNLTPPQTAYENLVVANVVGENIFYNDSTFDGNDPTANAADDAAIATDKTALLPGQTATFANYTSYSRGINGIMVDIAGLPGNVTASDFVFMVGNSNDATTWTQLTVAPTVTIRWGAGAQGSDRVELTWANNTIQNEWLQVTVLADADTGLSANTVFYYGNAIGETGNSTTDAQVTVADETLTQSHVTPHANITNVYDFNRDGQVSAGDISIVAANLTTSATALNLISVPVAATTTPFATVQPDFLESSGEYYYFFAPVIVETSDGTLISVAEARTSIYDAAVEGIAETTSTDGGQTWSPVSIIAHAPDYPNHYLGMGSLVVDQTTGSVFFVYTVDNAQVLLMSTSDDGQTWTTPQDITSSVENPIWGYFATGPGNGIQLTIGPDAGRLLIAFDYRYAAGTLDATNPSYDGVIYSDDNGATWQFGGGPSPLAAANVGVNEATIVQLSSGAIYMNSRLKFADNNTPARGYSVSDDGGMTWSNVQYDYSLPVSSVEGSLISLDPNTLVFAAPDDPDNSGVRQQMTIWASFDEGQTWTKEQTVNYEFASYSGMVALGHDSALLEFNVGNAPGADETPKIELVKFNLAGLLSQQPAQFTWNFNEQPIGQAAPIGSSSIRDDGPLDQRGTVQSSGGVPYYVPGSNGDEALRIVNGSNVLLSPGTTDGLQFGTGQSFTFQFVLRTTQANGVLLGALPGDPGYTFRLSNGAITLNLNDGSTSETLTGTTIDDGAWHTVVGVRDATAHTLSLYVDGALVGQMPDITGSLQNVDDITLGSYADGSSQLTFDIDLLQVTRAALTPSQFLTSSYVPPQTLPAPTTAANNVLNLPGLGFYLPPYDDRHYFSDPNESDPLLIQPTPGTAARSAIDATGQYDVQGLGGATTYYEADPVVGSYWSSQNGVGWTVANSSGAQSPNTSFDFVQNTETFTISDIFNVPAVPTDGSFQLVGNNSDTSAMPGFDLTVDSSGNLHFNVTDGTGSGSSLIEQNLATYSSSNNSLPQLSTGDWYQIVIVGNGPGTPLQYYLTPMSATQVQQYQTSTTMTPIATATESTQNLQIANLSNGFTPTGISILNFKDLAIFNQALTASQVQQLFLDEANPPVVTASGTIDTFTVGGAAMAIDSGVTVSSEDADLTAATVTISSGTLQAGDTLNFTNQNGISGSYSGGVLTLSGTATPAQYQAALASVTFSTTNTSTTSRAISIVASDGPLNSSPTAEQVNVSTITPVLVASGTTNGFTLGGAAVVVDSGLAGSPTGADLTSATLTISSGTLKLGDTLNFANQNGISGSYAAGVLTLTGSASMAQYVAALKTVTFSTTSTITTNRAISVVALDGALHSTAVSEQVAVLIPPPVVTPSGASGTYTIGGAALAVDAGLTVFSYDTDLTGATVTISAGTLESGDRLNFANQNGISGSYSGGVLTMSGIATPAQYQAALQSVTFTSTTTVTSITTRSVSIIALDNALIGNPAAESFNVGNDFVIPSGLVASYTAGAPPVHIDSGITVSSSDTHLSGATVTISSGTLQSGDTLSFTSPVGSGISGVYSGGVLTLSGSATVAQYQAALQSLRFSTTSGSAGTRSISIVTIDNTIDSNVAPESVIVSTPVTITALYVNGSSWSKFDAYLGSNGYGSATLGYALLTGSSQLTPLPWSTINQIDVQFSGPIKGGAIAASSIELVGGTGGAGRAAAAPTVTSVTSLGGNAYQINLSGSLGYNDYILAIASTGSSFGPAITDTNGAGISGAFTTGSSSFPSGNGLASGAFDFAFDVLPGDGNQNGSVNAQDSARVGQLLNDKTTGATAANYSPFYDYNANGTTNTQDSSIVSQGLNLKMSNIIPPLAPSAQLVVEPAVVGPVVVIPSATGLTALELGVQESGQAGGSASLTAGGSSTSAAGNVNSTGATSAATTSTNSAATVDTANTGSSTTTTSGTSRRDHGRHAFGAIDEAVADFDLADLWA